MLPESQKTLEELKWQIIQSNITTDYKIDTPYKTLTMGIKSRTRNGFKPLYPDKPSTYHKYTGKMDYSHEPVKMLTKGDFTKLLSLRLPTELYIFWDMLLKNGCNITVHHVNFRNWSFVSTLQIIDLVNYYSEHGQNDLIDIAYYKQSDCYYSFRLCWIPSIKKFVLLQDLKNYSENSLFAKNTYNFKSSFVNSKILFNFHEAFGPNGFIISNKYNALYDKFFHNRYNLLTPDEMISV